ncbi:MAG: TIGR03545 family protein [Deltaproteobacteria bacterium]|nr:TIGR03545 family protein [Deltaproteobacteria bacterium]MBI3294408.1 TIGR03545 family protein [Deltaproteobacteria bacterium]
MSNTPSSKTAKGAGLIRWGGLIPVGVLFVGPFVYLTFFFDSQLMDWLSRAGAAMNGAKVDIGELKTSFLNCTFEAKRIEIANPLEPMRNRASIDRIYYSFLFGPVLEKKFVIKEASITGIQWGTERKESGSIPNPPPKPKGPGLMDGLIDNLEKTARKQAEGTSISQFTGIFSGNLDANIERLGTNSNSFKRYSELSNELSEAANEWKRFNEGLPSQSTFGDLKTKAEALANQKPGRPEEIATAIQTAVTLKNSIESNISSLNQSKETLTGNVQKINQQISSFDDAINADIASVRQSLHIPSVELKDITPSILGPHLMHWVTEAIYWADLSRKYLPKRAKDQSMRVEVKRARGTDIHFAKVRTYPTFLVEKASIQSNVGANSRAGNIEGSILGLNTNPPAYGKPTSFSLKGEFPAARIYGANISIVLDHVSEDAYERAHIKMDAFPIENAILSTDPSLSLGIENASGKASIDLLLADNKIEGEFTSMIAGVRYKTSSTRPELDAILKSVTGRLAAFEMKASVKGTFDDLKFKITSDLGEKLATAISSEFQKQITILNERVKKVVESEIAVKKADLLKQFEKERALALAPIDDRIQVAREALKIASTAESRFEAEKNRLAKQTTDQAKAKAAEKVQEAGKALKNSIKIPGF